MATALSTVPLSGPRSLSNSLMLAPVMILGPLVSMDANRWLFFWHVLPKTCVQKCVYISVFSFFLRIIKHREDDFYVEFGDV